MYFTLGTGQVEVFRVDRKIASKVAFRSCFLLLHCSLCFFWVIFRGLHATPGVTLNCCEGDLLDIRVWSDTICAGRRVSLCLFPTRVAMLTVVFGWAVLGAFQARQRWVRRLLERFPSEGSSPSPLSLSISSFLLVTLCSGFDGLHLLPFSTCKEVFIAVFFISFLPICFASDGHQILTYLFLASFILTSDGSKTSLFGACMWLRPAM